MPKLIQLPDGTWVDPDTITLVKAFDGSDNMPCGGYVAPYVTVECGGKAMCFEVADLDAACNLRDKIASMANGARDGYWTQEDGKSNSDDIDML